MAIEKEKFFEIINEVSKSGGLDEDNLLERIKNELKGKDAGEYNKFSKNFSKEHQFSIKILEEAAEDWTLLHLATACNNMLIVELLLKKKASVSARVKDGSKNDGLTALHIAASCGHKDMVKRLLNDNRVNPSLKSKNKTPREIVGNTENKEAIEEMLKKAEQNFYTKHEKKTDVSADVINSVKQYNTIRSGAQAPVTCESSDSIVSEQYLHAGVKNMVEKFESPQRGSVTYSGKQTPIGESVSSDDNGLALETTFDTSSYSEINYDGAANEVDNQTLESLQTQVQLKDSQIRKLEKPGK
ncbi:ankyrin repeat domain-containing protein [Wolbachia endosymbiont (group B) of Apotomis betuletana]|nr:ankyrin repeat domain-containing protein [Wolbachia endosymbiont (group B) of Apotomis betuletana]